jgi:hypothetical protein
MGGQTSISPSAAFDFHPYVYRVYWVNPNPAVAGSLPDARRLRTGGPVLFASNVGSTNSFTIKDNAGNTLFTVALGKTAELWLKDNSTAAGVWAAKITTTLT